MKQRSSQNRNKPHAINIDLTRLSPPAYRADDKNRPKDVKDNVDDITPPAIPGKKQNDGSESPRRRWRRGALGDEKVSAKVVSFF